MSNFPLDSMGSPGQLPPIPPRPAAYRQGVRGQYYNHNQETTESPGYRIPYQETEVLISTVDSHPSSVYTETNLSRTSSQNRRQPENYALDSSYNRNHFSETTEPEGRVQTHNTALERGRTETEQAPISDGMSEGLHQLGFGGMSFYDTSKPNWTPPSAPSREQDYNNNESRTKSRVEPTYEYPIPMDFYEPFTTSFKPAAAPPSPPPVERERPTPTSATSSNYEYNTPRPNVPHLSVSDPFPISVDHERYYSELNSLRESQYPEPVNLGGSDPFYQPPSRSLTSYRRTPRRPNEDTEIKLDNNGLPSLGCILGPNGAQPATRTSFNFDDEKGFYPNNNYNQSTASFLSTHSENITPSSRYNDLRQTPSYASLRPDNDTRVQSSQREDEKCGVPPPPTRYLSQRQGGNKLGQLLQEKKMEYVVSEINRKDELHRRIQEESRNWSPTHDQLQRKIQEDARWHQGSRYY
ncbi:hypothetical protein AA313_de0207117 [Arthrobotrys entomopaga]|nr:hypothetical protein AA313_de0207117 [Arthrobotrys entomopaga]